MAVLFVVLTIIVALTVDYGVQRLARARSAQPVDDRAVALAAPPALSPPPSTFLCPTHAWLDLLPSGALRLGVDALVTTVFGKPEELTCAAAGSRVARGAPLVTLRSGERSLVIPAPVEGTVEKVRIPPDLSALEARPYGANWICELRPVEVGPVLRWSRIGEEATSWLRDELGRLRDFISGADAPGAPVAVAADGGYPVAGFGLQLDSERWEELVARFFAGEVAPTGEPVEERA